MNEQKFIETYCHKCGTQRCEGIGTEWFEGCPYRWNLEGYGDPAAEIIKLQKQIDQLTMKLVKAYPNGLPRCNKCVFENYCTCDKDNSRTCPDYKRDAPDGGFYG